jgi:hypothetical protein
MALDAREQAIANGNQAFDSPPVTGAWSGTPEVPWADEVVDLLDRSRSSRCPHP